MRGSRGCSGSSGAGVAEANCRGSSSGVGLQVHRCVGGAAACAGVRGEAVCAGVRGAVACAGVRGEAGTLQGQRGVDARARGCKAAN